MRLTLSVVVALVVLTSPVSAQAPFEVAAPSGSAPAAVVTTGVVATDDDGVLLVGPAGTRRLLHRRDVLGAAASDSRLAVTLGRQPRFEGPFLSEFTTPERERRRPADPIGARSVLLGPLDGPLRRVARCGSVRAADIGAAVAGDVAVWRGCDARSVVADVAGARRTFPAGGTVVAVATDGVGVAWVVSRGADATALAVAGDPATGAVSRVGDLPALRPDTPASLAVRDGRTLVRASLLDDDATLRCVAFAAGPGPGVVPVAPGGCAPATLTAAGPIGAVDGALVAGLGTATPTRLIGFRGTFPPRFAASATRLAVTRSTCRTDRLAVLALDPAVAAAPLPACPLRPVGLRRRGRRLELRVRCPRGCRISAYGILGRTVLQPQRSVAARPGGVARLVLRLRRAAPVRARLVVTGNDGTELQVLRRVR